MIRRGPGDARGSPADALDRTAELIERLAVLLEAGIAPVSAWHHLVDDVATEETTPLTAIVADPAPTAAELADRIHVAAAASTTGMRDALAAVAAVWRVATASGAPLAPALSGLAETLRELAQSERELEVALAGPRSTSRIVLALPPLGLLLGGALGIDTMHALLGTTAGVACLVAGTALVVVAARWNAWLLRAARVREPAPGLAGELTAIALAGGASPRRALAAATAALAEGGLAVPGASVERQLEFARRAGVPARALLRSEARAARRRSRSADQRRGVELATRLVLPLGLCVLPAFVLLGVAPVAISLLSSTVTGW